MAFERHDIVDTCQDVRVVAMDSITHANEEFGRGDVLVGASFAGTVAVQFAARYGPRGVIAHDCGIGRWGAGITGLWYLEGRGIPAVAADSSTARIADGKDTWERGVVSVVNHWARSVGVDVGMDVRAAARRLCTGDVSTLTDDEPRVDRRVVAQHGDVSVAAMGSIRFAAPEDRHGVVCVGSHSGRTAAMYAVELSPRGFIGNDGGGGCDGSGFDGLAVLDEADIPGAAVAGWSASIGDGASTFADGVVSHHNEAARACGVTEGIPALDAARLMAALN